VIEVLGVVVVPVVVALITAAVSVIGIVRHNRRDVADLRSENSQQHQDSAVLLKHLSSQVGGIDRKIDRIDERVDHLQAWATAHEYDYPSKARPVRDTLP